MPQSPSSTELAPAELSRVIEMAWEDRTAFDSIERLYGLSESAIIKLMRSQLSHRAFKNWRQRVSGRKTKHMELRPDGIDRSHCPSQYKVRGNR